MYRLARFSWDNGLAEPYIHRVGGLVTVKLILFSLVCICSARNGYAQTNYTIQLGAGGLSLDWLSLMIEVRVLQFSEESPRQSMRVATGYGIPIFNAQYLPAEVRLIGFHGGSHVEAVLGCNIKLRWSMGEDNSWRQISSSPLNPAAAVVYRFEPSDGGVFSRLGDGCVYSVSDRRLLPCATEGLGCTF